MLHDLVNKLGLEDIFWDIALCSPVEVNRRFRGACCLYHQWDSSPRLNYIGYILLTNPME
jgi:hypothetical protein